MTTGKRAIDKFYKRRDRYEIPDWQRGEVWDREKQQLLIDSIIRGWKLPKFYFLKISDDPEEYYVVDGQQRLRAIWEFFDNKLPLSKKSARAFGGDYYKDLAQEISDKFDDFEIEYDVVSNADDKEIKEVFQRLQTGLPLTSSEKLNAVHGNLRDFVRKLSQHNFFKNKVSVSDKRYGHFDVCAKVAVVEIEGLDTNLRFDDMSEVFESHSTFSPRSAAGRHLQETFDYLDKVFPSGSPALRNRTVVQSFATLASKIATTDRAKGTEASLHTFLQKFNDQLIAQVERGKNATDLDYPEFQRTVNANVKSGVRIRHRILLKKLLQSDPMWGDLFGPGVVSEIGLPADILKQAESLEQLVGAVNTKHQAASGVDLLKPTNKTLPALRRIGKPIRNLEDYRTFIDDLYFIFWEGSGNRLEGKQPESFKDINVLRTYLRHDVNHGSQGKVAAKRRQHAATFKKYSGGPSPEALDAEQFLVVQSNILRALERDLGTL